MEENAGASEPEPPGGRPSPVSLHASIRTSLVILAAILLGLPGCAPDRTGDTLAHIRSTGRLAYGSDAEGGGPYAYPDPEAPGSVTGFEVELMDRLARELGPRPV